MAIQMANHSVTYPNGIMEYLFVKEWKFVFLIDFVVPNIEKDDNIPIIPITPFLSTTTPLVDIDESMLT